MNLKNVKLEKETEHAWHVHDGKSSFPVAKKGLSKALHAQITQHFSDENGTPTDQVVQPEPGSPAAMQALMAAGRDPNLLNAPQTQAAAAPMTPGPSLDPEAEASQYTTGWTGNPSLDSRPGVIHPGQPAGPVKKQQKQTELAETAPAAPTPEAPKPTPFKMPSGGVPGADQEIQKGYAERETAEQAKAQLATNAAEETLAMQQKQAEERTALTKQWGDRWEANQKQSDQVAADIAASKIDPSKYWQNHSKVTAGISLILGGIGAGLAGGPNQAMALLNKNIDNELDAQKANLGKQQNLLSHYMQQGHSIQEAQQLARADLLDAQRGQLQMMATKYAGPQAQAAALDAIGQLKTQAVGDRQAAYGRTLMNQKAGLEMQQTVQSMKYQQQMMDKCWPKCEAASPLPPGAEDMLPDEIKKSGVHVTEDVPIVSNGHAVLGPDGAPLTKKVAVFRRGVGLRASERRPEGIQG